MTQKSVASANPQNEKKSKIWKTPLETIFVW